MKKREVLLLALSILAALFLNMLFTDPAVFGLFVTKAAHAVVALALLRIVLWYFDKVIGLNFKHRITNFDSTSMAIYLGARFVGACLLFGMVFG